MLKTRSVGTLIEPSLRWTRAGFTLVELLLVVAIIGVLASLLLSALASAKSKGQGVACLSNQRQLILGWMLYADDHDDTLPYNLGDDEMLLTVEDGTYLNWVNNLLNWETDASNTNVLLVSRGGLGPYCSGNVRIFKCPVDSVLSDLQRQAGWSGRTRSVSMNAMVGDAGEFSYDGFNTNNPYYRQFFRSSQIQTPSSIFVFIEEHPDSIGDGYFLNKPDSGEWRDLPASYHDGGANLSFADGHVERHKWLSPSTRLPARPDTFFPPMTIPPKERADFDWLMTRTSYRTSTHKY
jgi:prepilin-type N-terminal cleavage/methylation domain-containing protein/prepilin-type processing-associated H-X9-DG protein